MSDEATSPFARLDTSLLRSTQSPTPAVPPAEPDSPPPARPVRTRARPASAATVQPRHPDTTVDTTTPRHRDTTPATDHDAVIDRIRRTVRAVGKEAATLRLTAAEKERLAEIVYLYKRQGKRTSETELIRIATNYMLEDYRHHGEESVLAQVMVALES